MRKKTIYIARKVKINDECSSVIIFEEGVFSTFNAARSFVKEIADPEETDFYRWEVVAYILDSQKPWEGEETYYFDKNGKIIRKYSSVKEDNERICKKYSGVFKLGDIVFVKAYPWNSFSCLSIDMIGVISWCPSTLNSWVARGKEKREWFNEYTIDYIDVNGWLDHFHICEEGIEVFSGEIPNNHKFLSVLARHYRGEKKIPSNVFKEIIESKIYLRKEKNLDDKFLD